MCITEKKNPRCETCRTILIKGTPIEGLVRIVCGTCGKINTLHIEKPKQVACKKIVVTSLDPV